MKSAFMTWGRHPVLGFAALPKFDPPLVVGPRGNQLTNLSRGNALRRRMLFPTGVPLFGVVAQVVDLDPCIPPGKTGYGQLEVWLDWGVWGKWVVVGVRFPGAPPQRDRISICWKCTETLMEMNSRKRLGEMADKSWSRDWGK